MIEKVFYFVNILELLSCCHNKNATNGCETKSSTFILLYKIHETICLYH